jgi:DNA-binding MarR family transcriptional regulator
MSDLVLDHQRRRQVSDAVGLSFSRTRAVRRVADAPLSMKDLAAALDIDPPNATVLVDDLEAQGLVRRRPHPTDRRAKIVEATPKGKSVATRANDILGTPPDALGDLGVRELEELRRVLASITKQT